MIYWNEHQHPTEVFHFDYIRSELGSKQSGDVGMGNSLRIVMMMNLAIFVLEKKSLLRN